MNPEFEVPKTQRSLIRRIAKRILRENPGLKDAVDRPEILQAPHPLLLQRAQEVTRIDGEVREVVNILHRAFAQDVVGVAAPQIGRSLQIFVASFPYGREVFINPEYIEHPSGKVEFQIEGCLSTSKFRPVGRHRLVGVSYLNLDGEIKNRQFKDELARIVQHEMDHLDGILITTRKIDA